MWVDQFQSGEWISFAAAGSVGMSSSPSSSDRTSTWPVGALGVAVLLAAISLGGILLASTYARETASWRAQGIGQDWFDLLVVVPVLVTGAIRLHRGSRAARVVLGGALIYSAYSFVLYAFAVLNALFLVYCAAVGSSVFSAAGLLATAVRDSALRLNAATWPATGDGG